MQVKSDEASIPTARKRIRKAAGRGGGLIGVTIFAAALLGGCGSNQTPVSQSVPDNAQKVIVTASNFKWTLSRSTFAANRPIDFEVRAAQNAHGFSIVGTKIHHDVVQGQPPVDLVWTPPKPGQYVIRCDVPCGSGHYNMFTRITVK